MKILEACLLFFAFAYCCLLTKELAKSEHRAGYLEGQASVYQSFASDGIEGAERW